LSICSIRRLSATRLAYRPPLTRACFSFQLPARHTNIRLGLSPSRLRALRLRANPVWSLFLVVSFSAARRPHFLFFPPTAPDSRLVIIVCLLGNPFQSPLLSQTLFSSCLASARTSKCFYFWAILIRVFLFLPRLARASLPSSTVRASRCPPPLCLFYRQASGPLGG